MKNPGKKYREYRAWFDEKVKDPAHWAMLRSERQCANYLYSNDEPFPYEYGEWCVVTADPVKMRAAIVHKVEEQHAKFAEASQHVGGNINSPLLEQEYIDRAQATKELREKLKTYSGSSDFASDELFRIKKQADESGKDFVKVAQDTVIDMKGPEIDPVELRVKFSGNGSIQKEDKEQSLAQDFLHLLWKHGFPVEKFIKKRLSVKVAEGIGKDED